MAGIIFLTTVPAMMITSAWRGEARKASMPKRAMSQRLAAVQIISMAQQASPKVAGQRLLLRPQSTSFSRVVVRTLYPRCSSIPIQCSLAGESGGKLRPTPPDQVLLFPLQGALAPDVNQAHHQDADEDQHLVEPEPAQGFEDHRPG